MSAHQRGSNNMKVLQIVKTSEGANWAYEQAKCLSDNGVEVVTIIPDKNGKVAKKYISSKMRVIIGDYSLPINRPWRYFSRKKEIQKIVKQENPDIIHIHFVTNAVMIRLALKKDKTPRLFQVPGPLHLENRLTRKLELASAKDNDYWAPSCEYSQSIYEKYVPKNKVFLAYYGGYGGEKCAQYKKTNKLRKEYNIGTHTKIIGMVSYFYKPKYYLGQTRGIKGHEDFIDAISILNSNITKPVQAIVIGGTWGKTNRYEKKVKKYSKNKGVKNIIFTGYRDDIKDIYKDLDIVVHPSLSENLGGAAESLAAGVPTIATNIGGFPDIVRNKETGLLCEPKNPESIAECIQFMLQNENSANIMAKQGKKLVESKLDILNTTKRLFEIYNQVINNNE